MPEAYQEISRLRRQIEQLEQSRDVARSIAKRAVEARDELRALLSIVCDDANKMRERLRELGESH